MASPGDLLVISRPPASTREQLAASLGPMDLARQLGPALFPFHALHQSLSLGYPPGMRQVLLQAMAAVRARAFVMQLDRIRSNGTIPGEIHWELFPSTGKSMGMVELLDARIAAFQAYGIRDNAGHSAHLSVSYFARQTLRTMHFAPVAWLVDGIELVEVRGSGRDYQYVTVAAFPLEPMQDFYQVQTPLFS